VETVKDVCFICAHLKEFQRDIAISILGGHSKVFQRFTEGSARIMGTLLPGHTKAFQR